MAISVLVTGATGQQGGAVAKALLKKGHKVRAMTRKPTSPHAMELKSLGAEIVIGDFDKPATIEQAAKGMYTAFLMSTFFEKGISEETNQAKAAVDALKKAQVKHVVYTSVACADKKTGIPHFESKYAVEQYLKSQKVPHSIIAPVFFMENLLGPWFLPHLQKGNLAIAMPGDKKLAQIALSDIGSFAAVIVENSNKYMNQRFDIASDMLTGEEAAAVLSKACRRKINYMEIPLEEIRKNSADMAKMFQWFQNPGYAIDTKALRKNFPDVTWHTFEKWAKVQHWNELLQKSAA